MHELALEVEERPLPVDGQGRRELDHTSDHERSHLPRRPRHGEDEPGEDGGHHGRQHHAQRRLELGGGQRERGLAHAAGNGRQAFLGGHDDDGHGQEGQGEGSPEDAARTEGGRGQRFGEEEAVDGAPDAVDEEAEAEDAEDDGGDARQIVHGDAHRGDERALLRVLAQVEGRKHSEGRDHEAHQDHHQDGSEDGREHATLGVGLPRLAGHELPEMSHIVGALVEQSHLIGKANVEDLGQRNVFLLAAVSDHHHGERLPLPELRQARRLRLVLGLERGQLSLDRLDLRPRRRPPELEPLELETERFLLRVDGADLGSLDGADPAPHPIRFAHAVADLRPGGGRSHGDRPPAVPHFLDGANQEPPLGALDDGHIAWVITLGDLDLAHPLEVGAIEVPVRHLQLDAELVRPAGHRLPFDDLTRHDRAVRQRQPHHVLGPEEAHAVLDDEGDEPDDQQEGQGQRSAREPDKRLAGTPETL